MPTILLPSFPGRPNVPDPAFGWEAQAAKKAGFGIAFIDVELQLGGDVKLRRIPTGEDRDVVYRGWIMRPAEYKRLDDALKEQGLNLIVGSDAYNESYEFPRWYRAVTAAGDITPLSMVFPIGFDLDTVVERLPKLFWGGPVIVKDFVKSRKQDWFDACFIPDTSDTENVRKVISKFLELMSDGFYGGLVFREFVPLMRLGSHPKSHMPLVNEWRIFVLDGKIVYQTPYWATADYTDASPPPATIQGLIDSIGYASPFYAIDLAQCRSGKWLVIEINDGGISGVPESGSIDAFYAALAAGITSRRSV